MTMKVATKVLTGLLMAFGIVSSAHAILAVSLNNGGGAVTCQDGAACDAAGAPGVVSFTNSVGTITVASIGSGAPALPALSLDLTWNVTEPAGSPASTYTIMVSQTDLPFNFPLGGSGATFSGLAAGTQTNG